MRFEAPLLFNNCAQFKKDVISVAENIRGQILGVGIGTRTGSMKSANAASIAGTKDIPMRSTLLISGDIVPNYDTVSADSTVNKVVIIDFSAISIIDASGLEAMIEIHTELCDRKFNVSMNGCRDLITLSTATSNHDFEQGSSANAVVNANSYFVTDTSTTGAAPRPSLPETRVSPPPISPIKLRATTSNGN
uniref:STAS domain-containing protein n=1 Tax=Panagrolaimus davidi TaxID=227884 RepID=A0A914QRS5_9BILA